jgi:hypothetical protein
LAVGCSIVVGTAAAVVAKENNNEKMKTKVKKFIISIEHGFPGLLSVEFPPYV